MELVTIATFSTSIEAHIQKGYLENEGIPCFLKDEHTISANPMYDVAMGGIKLQVWESDAQRAYNLLQETKQQAPETPAINYKHKLTTGQRIAIAAIILFILVGLIISLN
ncbi:MAG: DUF2007 domain-containing protein [Sphingobacteriales bacterium]|nr:MAG: DUF2007 domain-containing protein [Sphingobacteriales bacterium]